ncbi:hypothetical protein BASA81_008023 [Batrachochytrium salamandrivorans]|nr:hypothetical protein BASA81_008023 [Batrachochytrium salamandrivorans]
MPITVRVRHAAGTLRIERAEPGWTLAQIKSEIRQALGLPDSSPIVLYDSPPSTASVAFADDSLTLNQAGVAHGAMLYLDHKILPPSTTSAQAPSTAKRIDLHGNLVASTRSQTGGAEFRPGLLSLRDQKLHWTLTEMTELDDHYTFVIKGKEPNFCSQVSLDIDSAQDFQKYCQENGFGKSKCALMFGRFVDNDYVMEQEELIKSQSTKPKQLYGQTKGKMRVMDLKTDEQDQLLARQRVEVDFLYYPEMVNEYQIRFDGSDMIHCLALAQAMGLQCVGIIFSHAKRDVHFHSREILMCGEACLEATNGSTDSPFVICKVCPDENGLVQMDSYQLTKTCLEMQREEALLAMTSSTTSGFCAVDPKFMVIIEAKPSEVVDCDYFIKRVPIQSHASCWCRLRFPRENRYDTKWNSKTLHSLVGKLGSQNEQWLPVLRDFHLLYFLCLGLGVETVVEICRFVYSVPSPREEDPFPEGFALMIKEVANV